LVVFFASKYFFFFSFFSFFVLYILSWVSGPTHTPLADGVLSKIGPEAATKFLQSIPAGRMGEPGDVAGVLAFLLSPAARYMVGTAVVVDGGLML
jgi:dihydroanticapsin dehydrogenase